MYEDGRNKEYGAEDKTGRITELAGEIKNRGGHYNVSEG